MKTEKAIELVMRYATLTKQIKALNGEIGKNLDECKGVSGNRNTKDPFRNCDVDDKNRETDVHLVQWYTPERGEWGYSWLTVSEGQSEECPHCYAAHLAIQERKAARKSLGSVKSAMTRCGSHE